MMKKQKATNQITRRDPNDFVNLMEDCVEKFQKDFTDEEFQLINDNVNRFYVIDYSEWSYPIIKRSYKDCLNLIRLEQKK